MATKDSDCLLSNEPSKKPSSNFVEENDIPKAEDVKHVVVSTFEKLKENANTLFQDQKYNEAIKAYTDVLQLPDLSSQNKAVIYSNRSASYLMLGNSLNSAKIDAEKAVKCWPSWWKSYYRLTRAYVLQGDWKKAEETVKLALSLNPESKLVLDELYGIRQKFANIFGRDILTLEEVKKMFYHRYNLSEDALIDSEKLAHRLSEVDVNLVRGYQYKYGIFVPIDHRKSFECFTKAANMENVESMVEVGKAYFNGKGVKQEYDEALKWLLKAANSTGHPCMHPDTVCMFYAQNVLGLIYENGIGVNKDCRKAAEWYQKAVKNGFPSSATNLGNLYTEGLGFERSYMKAFYHYKFGAEMGDTDAMLNLARRYIFAEGTFLKIITQEYIDQGKKWLQIASQQGDKRGTEELQMFKNLSPLEVVFYKSRRSDDDKRSPLDFEQFGEYVEEAAKNGSRTAQEHMEIWKNLNEALEAFKKNESGKLLEALAKAIRLHYQIVKIPEFYKQIITKSFDLYNLDSVVCHIQMERERSVWPEYIPSASNLFPDNEYLAEMTALFYLHCKQNSNAASKHVAAFLKRHPHSFRVRYCQIRILTDSYGKSFKFIDAFIAAAPEDNPYVPACHYIKARYYSSRFKKQRLRQCFEAGLAAEKKQLPCFLPFHSKDKKISEINLISKRNGHKTAKMARQAYNQERRMIDPKRKYLITQNRDLVVSSGRATLSPDIASLILNKLNPPVWSPSLKKISLEEMDPTKDKVYNGYILIAKIIDWPVVDSCVHTVIEDLNGEIHSLTISNWELSGEMRFDMIEVMKVFRPNVKITIVNPHYRISNTGKKDIFVNGPDHIKLDSSKIDKFCHVCGKKEKTLSSCSDCKMAHYCSKECEELDQIEFNHKKICKDLKSCSNMM